MPLVLYHTKRVREALREPSGLLADLVFLGFAVAVIGLIVMMGEQASKHYDATQKTIISLSLWSLPKYTLMSLCRGFAAYTLSLIFTLIYGTIAAHNHRAEKVMIPALDVLQAIPVLGFLPGLVLAMISIFPSREIGLEISCVVMIFTAQVWNMTFSFHGSLRGIPQPLREVAAIQHLTGWQTFKLLEVPASMIGLVWNSMMSMAGGWFFLTVNEAFTLKDRDYRLPGIGSYMNEAILQFTPGVLSSWGPIVGAIVAMVIMIVAVDQIFWRPIVVWAQRFRMDDIAQTEVAQSWMLDLLRKSRIYLGLSGLFDRKHKKPQTPFTAAPSGPKVDPLLVAVPANEKSDAGVKPVASGRGRQGKILLSLLNWLVLLILVAGAIWGGWELIRLLTGLPLWDSKQAAAGASITEHKDWAAVVLALFASFLRTSTAVILGAAWALPVGIMIGLSPKWSSRLQPIIQVVASFPAPMLFPLVTMALLVLHVPFTGGCVALMLLGAQWYILFNVIAGASAIPQDLQEVGSVYRMSRWEKWKRIYLPCTFPYLVTGLVTAAGGAWNATIVSEYVVLQGGATYKAFGLGSIISVATNDGNFSLLAAGVVIMAVAVVQLNRFFWKRLFRLAEGRYSLNV